MIHILLLVAQILVEKRHNRLFMAMLIFIADEWSKKLVSNFREVVKLLVASVQLLLGAKTRPTELIFISWNMNEKRLAIGRYYHLSSLSDLKIFAAL
jgi:hypothetical protein